MKMGKAQISFEFMLIFAFALLAFIAIASFLPAGIEKSNSSKASAQKLANEIKLKSITASLSVSDFKGEIPIPQTIGNEKIKVEMYKKPDNLIKIKSGSGELLAISFLPRIDSLNVIDPDGSLLKIEKNGNILSMTLQ